MTIEDADRAAFYLQHLNYYRLAAYWLPFQTDANSHRFRENTSFDQVLDHYIFDRELRLLVLDAIERIEVSVRAQWAYQMAHRHGSHAHLDRGLSHRSDYWDQNYSRLEKAVQESDETFIQHFLHNYSEALPPVWAVCEVMSLGQLSRWYRNLRPMQTRTAISGVYGLNEGVLASWLHHLTHVRNYCAHHSRLWNREFTITPTVPRGKASNLRAQFQVGSRRPYNTLVILLHFLDVIAPGHHWRVRLRGLIERHDISVQAMGFPAEWKTLPIWRDR